jgi:hypothetical protein
VTSAGPRPRRADRRTRGRPRRHALDRPAAQQSNRANFYQAAPANYYAQFWHANAINGLQYGFPYDDDAGQSSDISISNPQYLVVAVGW